MVAVKVVGSEKQEFFHGKRNGIEILKELGISVNSAIIIRNGKPIPEDEDLNEDDELTVIKSFSGG